MAAIVVIDERLRINPENKMTIKSHPAEQSAAAAKGATGGERRFHLVPILLQMTAEHGLGLPGEPGTRSRPCQGAVEPDQTGVAGQVPRQSGRVQPGADFFGDRFQGRWLER